VAWATDGRFYDEVMAKTAEDLVPTALLPVVTLTDQARQVVRDAMAQEPDPASLALWLEIRGVADGAFTYDLYFQALADADDEDAVFADGDVSVVVPQECTDNLRGARLEWSEEGDGGLVLVNPNTPSPELAAAGVPPEILAAGLDNPLAAGCWPCWSSRSTPPSPPTAVARTWSAWTRPPAWPTCASRAGARAAPCRA